MRRTAKPFDATTMPEWARNSEAVLWLCQRDPSYRGEVCMAKTQHWQRFLIHKAERLLERTKSRMPNIIEQEA